jgi:hypothetical protein
MQGRRLFCYLILFGLSFCSAASYWSLISHPAAPLDHNYFLYSIEFFYALLSHALVIVIGWQIFKSQQGSLQNKASHWHFFSDGWAILSLGVLHVGFIVANWRAFYFDGDEYYRAVAVLWHPTLQAAVLQYQQPLAYGAGRFFEILLGVSEFTMRIPSALYGFLSGIVFFLVLRGLKVGRGLAWIISLFFCFSFHMDRFSHENSPYALALLTCLIFLNFSIDFFEETSLDSIKDRLIDLGLGVLFFSLSVGLQPVAFITFFTFFTFLFKWRDRRFRYFFVTVCASLIPAIIITCTFARFALPHRTNEDFIAEALKLLSSFFEQPWREVLLSPHPWSFILVLFFVSSVFLSLRRKVNLPNWHWILFLQWALFPLLLFITFKIVVQFGFSFRYLIVLLIPAWITLALSAESIIQNVKLGSRSFGVFLFFVIMLVAGINEPRIESDPDLQKRQNAKGMYEQLAQRLNPEDFAMQIVVRRYSFDDAYEGVLYMRDVEHQKDKNFVSPYKALLSVTQYLDEIIEGKRPRKNLIFVFQASAETLAKIETLLAPVPNVRFFTRDFGYLAYRYQLGEDGLISQDFIDLLEQQILPVEPNSRFQAPMLALANAVLKKDKNQIDILKQKIEQIFPPNLDHQKKYFKKVSAKLSET